ncbi:MAG: PH domain-containing protein [Flavobacteriia bacterium]|nr:PH domain-containing protein [Flavobacteriia bacterium]
MDYNQPQKLAPIALLRVFSRVLRAMIGNLWPVLLVYFFQINRREDADDSPVILYLAYGVLIITVISGVIRYLTFRWNIDDDALIIRHGVFRKVDLRIPFERIQAIDLQQPWYYQIGNAARFVVDTAGSKSKEAEIWALRIPEAEKLRSYIHERKADVVVDSETESDSILESKPTKTWVKVDIGTLVKVGLLRNHFRSIAAFIGGGFYLYSQLQDVFETEEVNREIEQIYSVVPKVMSAYVIIGMLVIMAAITFSILLTIFRFYGFNLIEKEGAFVARYGLTSVKTRQLKERKVQIMRTEQGPVFKLAKIMRFKIEQAYAEKVQNRDDFSIPGSPQAEVLSFHKRLFGSLPKMVHPGTSFKWFWFRMSRIGVLPILPFVALAYFLVNPTYYWALLWFPYQAFYSYFLWKNQGVSVDNNVLSVRKQVVFEKRATMELQRVQAVQVVQSIFQRRNKLATLKIETAGGSVTLPFLPIETATKLANYLLYKSETAKLDWM